MSSYQHILAVIDPEHSKQPALSRALYLANKLGARITVISCIYDYNYEFTSMLTSDERDAMKHALLDYELEKMQDLIEQHNASKLANYQAIWHKKLYQGIIDNAITHNCDLIVKSTKPHSSLSQRLFTPNDWNLLRNSPVNVLMVKDHVWHVNGNIVSAISLDNSDDEHECLSQLVTDESYKIAELLKGNLHLANTFLGAPINITIEAPQFSAEVYNNNLREHHQEEMKKLASGIKLSAERVHVKEGLPEDVIPQICDTLDAELLVLGSVGRKGLAAALLGNTAEHIIDKINCDTLVVKPSAK